MNRQGLVRGNSSSAREVLVVLGVVALMGVAAPSACAKGKTETRPLEQLWSQYPLSPQGEHDQAAPGSGVRRKRGAGGADHGGLRLIVILPLVAVGLAAAAASALIFNVSRWEGVLMTVFRRDRGRSNPADNSTAEMPDREDPVARIRAATSIDGATQRAIQTPPLRGGEEARSGDVAAGGADEARREGRGAAAVTVEKVGEHIAGVLESAEEAARRIREQAQREANHLVERTTREMEEVRARATSAAEKQQHDATRALREAEEASEMRKAAADEYSDRRRHEADERFAAILTEAKAEAASIAETARERHEELLADVAVTENRMRALSSSLKSVAFELDDAVTGEADPLKDPDGRARGGTLDGSLRTQAESVRRSSVSA